MTNLQAASKLKRARYLASRCSYRLWNFDAEDVAQEMLLDAVAYESRTGQQASLCDFSLKRALRSLRQKGSLVVRPNWLLEALAKSQNPDHLLSKILTPSYDENDLEHEREDFSHVLDSVDRLSAQEKAAIMFEFFGIGEGSDALDMAMEVLRKST